MGISLSVLSPLLIIVVVMESDGSIIIIILFELNIIINYIHLSVQTSCNGNLSWR